MFDNFLNHLVHGMRGLGVEQWDTDVCVMHVVEVGAVSTVVVVVVVPVDSMSAMGNGSRCDNGCEGLGWFNHDTKLEGLPWYAGFRFCRVSDVGSLRRSQPGFAQSAVAESGVPRGKSILVAADLEFFLFDVDHPDIDEPLRRWY